jgi:elongation factor Ts
MGDCKHALEEAGGDIEKAIDLLRAKGIAKAEKRADRAASEGQVVTWVSDDGTLGSMVEVNSETDFVARNDEFTALVKFVGVHVAYDTSLDGVADVATTPALLDRQWHHDKSQTLGEVVKLAAGKTGENLTLRRAARFATAGADGAVGAYRHFNGRIGVLVEVTGVTGAAAKALANRIAEHVAAGVPAVPVAVSKEGVNADLVARERAIYVEQAKESGKPEAIVEKMVAGRVEKFYKEVTLLQQPWVRDPEKSIGQLVQELPGAAVRRFARFQMGEA